MAGIENFGTTVLEARRRIGLTQEALANKLGITPQAVSKWENGLGYPDVTLFPEIASVLEIPIERLFGVEGREGRITQFPAKMYGLDFIFSNGNRACYSSKSVERIDTENNVAYFTDGSTAESESGSVTNLGAGEIRFYDAESSGEVYDSGKNELSRAFSEFSSISAKISAPCSLNIKHSPDGDGRVEAHGSAAFISRINTELCGDTLSITFKNTERQDCGSQNELNIYLPVERGGVFKLSVSGSSDLTVDPDCGILEVSISGSGSLNAANCNIFDAKISGSGDVHIRRAEFSSNICISGAGDFTADSICSPSAKISGSGTINIKEVKGAEMNISVSGAAEIRCGGDVDTLKLKIGGVGTFIGEGLRVGEAYLQSQGSGEISIGMIRRASYERIGKNSKLYVLHRGEE